MLLGGNGWDHMGGGAGADTFVFASGGYADDVSDFQRGVDRICLSGFGSNVFGNDGQLQTLDHEGSLVNAVYYTYDGPAGDRIAYNEFDHTLYRITTQAFYEDDYYDWYNRITSATPIVRLQDVPTLGTSDIMVMTSILDDIVIGGGGGIGGAGGGVNAPPWLP